MATWFKEYRMQWIAEMLEVYGYINRAHLERKFNISTPQASADLREFMRANPGAMAYNASSKCYVARIS